MRADKIDFIRLRNASLRPMMASTDRSAMPPEDPPVKRIPIRSFVAALSYYTTASVNFSALACRRCRSSLDIHQPDPNQPDQFLGTCPSCGGWYRVASSSESGLTVLELPEPGQVDSTPPKGDGTG